MIGPGLHVRLARPSRDLAAAERCYAGGLGPAVLWRTTERVPGEHDLLLVGPPGAADRPVAAGGTRRTTRTGRSTA
ncbi:hypothetical protein ACFUV2_21335 [Streptomyces pilosus]|uniref:hypothetical protein n=1 Tax=Streptomyces pilosus TaxID=28893 RepID=UPI0036304C54